MLPTISYETKINISQTDDTKYRKTNKKAGKGRQFYHLKKHNIFNIIICISYEITGQNAQL